MNYITTDYRCGKCQKQYEFSINNNTITIRQFQCKHFLLKFISNLDQNVLRYMVSIKCLKCNKKQESLLSIANNQSMKDFNSNYFQCCGNQICFAVFFSDQKLESINIINNLAQSNEGMKINNFAGNNFNANNNLNQMSNINQNPNNFNNFNNNFQNMNLNNNTFANQNMNNMNVNQNFNNMGINNDLSNINMAQNMQFMNNNMNNFQNDQGFNNMQFGFNGMNNNFDNNGQIPNINASGQNDLNYAYLHGQGSILGQVISFYFQFMGQKYPVNKVKNNVIFKDVLNTFLNNNPDIKRRLSPNQRYMVSGDIVDVNQNLFANKIRDNSIVIIHWTGNS